MLWLIVGMILGGIYGGIWASMLLDRDPDSESMRAWDRQQAEWRGDER
jgi:hypothetical protein